MELRAEDVQPGRQQPPTDAALLWLLCRRRMEPLSCHPSAFVALLEMYKTQKLRVKTHPCAPSARRASIGVSEEEEEAELQLEYSRVSVTSKRWGLRHDRISNTRHRGPKNHPPKNRDPPGPHTQTYPWF